MKKGRLKGRSGKFHLFPKKEYPYTFWLYWVWLKP